MVLEPALIPQPNEDNHAIGFRSESIVDNDPVPIKTSIASLFHICILSFRLLIIQVTEKLATDAEFDLASTEAHYLEAHKRQLEDDFGRFKLWAGGCGAHRRGRVSLDHKLREALHVHDMVTSLLQDLEKTLKKAQVIAIGDEPTVQASRLSPEAPVSEETKSADLGSDSDSDSDVSIEEELPSTSKLDYAFMDITHVITCLYKFSVTLRQPALRDRLQKCAAIDVSHYYFWDIQHVSHKFPMAPKYLVERLGKANTKRRQLLMYHKKHHDKIARYVDENPNFIIPDRTINKNPPEIERKAREELLPPPTNFTSTIQSQTTVTVFRACPKPTAILNTDTESNDGKSHTSYATSVGTTTDGQFKLHVPSCPSDCSAPFQCPFCYDTIALRNTHSAWRDHVFKDLRPYVCTFQDCPNPDLLFESRSAWYQHEVQHHRREWFCASNECKSTPGFGTKDLLIDHLTRTHDDVHQHDLSALADRCQREILSNQSCPLCPLPNSHSATNIRRHLGRHMQQLSLFIISSMTTSDELSEDNVDGETDGVKSPDEFTNTVSDEGSNGNTLESSTVPTKSVIISCVLNYDGWMEDFDFSNSVATSHRPALINNITPNILYLSRIQVVGGMVYDPQRMCWIKVSDDDVMDDERDPFEGVEDVLDDERDPFEGVEDVLDEAGTNASSLGRGIGEWMVGEEFDIGPEFMRRQREEEERWRCRADGWVGDSTAGLVGQWTEYSEWISTWELFAMEKDT